MSFKLIPLVAALVACDAAVPDNTQLDNAQLDAESGEIQFAPAQRDATSLWLASLTDGDRDRLLALLDEARVQQDAGVPVEEVRTELLGALTSLGDRTLAANVFLDVPEPDPQRARNSSLCAQAGGYAEDAVDYIATAELQAFRGEFYTPTSNAYSMVFVLWYARNNATYGELYTDWAYSSSRYASNARSYMSSVSSDSFYTWGLALSEEALGGSGSGYWTNVRVATWNAHMSAQNASIYVGYC